MNSIASRRLWGLDICLRPAGMGNQKTETGSTRVPVNFIDKSRPRLYDVQNPAIADYREIRVEVKKINIYLLITGARADFLARDNRELGVNPKQSCCRDGGA